METLKEEKEKFHRGYLLRSRGYDVEKIAIQVGKLFGIEAKDLLKPGKCKAVVPARSVLCYWAVTELGESATSLAKRIGITQPAVSISVQRGEKIVREKNLLLESIL
jgi:chromosomal replication initiation ATPase DnaA